MKLLVVCQYYRPEPFRIADICEALAARGHEVHVVTGLPNYPEGALYPGYEHAAGQDETIHGVRVHRCGLHPRKKGALHRFWNYYSFVCSSCRYLSRLQEDFDVVFVNQLSPVMMAEGALRYAKKHGKRTVLYCLDLWPESLTVGGIRPGSLIYRVFWHISRRIYRQTDTVAITSRGFADYFRTVLKLPELAPIYLPQYAESLFDEIPPVTQHTGPFRFLFAGNIGEAQSVETILHAARQLSDVPVHFDIVGDGSDFSRCRDLAKGLGNVTFHGRKAIEEMPRFYAAADAMLVTLKADPQLSATLPGKVQSYMAAGRGVIGAIGGETAQVIADADCGVCVPPEDGSALAAAIRKIADTPSHFAVYGKRARHYYDLHFQKDVFLDRLTAILEENCP